MIKRLKFFLLSSSLLLAYILFYKIYFSRVTAFGCFDDCFNITAGYFMTKGKVLYSQIFFNHQPLMALLSYLIQSVFHPINIYELILRHRQVIFIFGFLFNLLIVWRFSLVGLGFVFFYEISKFYLFGDRFLAEGLIVYPLVYMTGLIWYKFARKKIFSWEYISSAIFVWFVVFMREPYLLLALFIYVLILWGKTQRGVKLLSFAVFLFLTLIVLISVPLNDYIFDVLTVNRGTVNYLFSQEILKSFFYPLYLLVGGKWNIFRVFLVGFDLIFISLLSLFLRISKKIFLMGFFLILGLANLRTILPGTIFYEAFHLLPWYALFVLMTFLILGEIYAKQRRSGILVILLLIVLFGYLIFSPQSYIREKINPQAEFLTNYGHFLEVGEVVKTLSNTDDTLFIDGDIDLIYWQANRLSPYKYSWFIPVMGGHEKFLQARSEMFASNPPDFSYGSKNSPEGYQRFLSNGEPTKLFVRNEKISEVSKERWRKAKEWSYELVF